MADINLKLEQLKSLLGISGTDEDALLLTLLSISAQKILDRYIPITPTLQRFRLVMKLNRPK